MALDGKQHEEERTGARFDRAILLETRRRTRALMEDLATSIQPGMVEEEGVVVLKAMLKNAGMFRGWHGPHLRFGRNTLKNFGEPSEPGVVLQPDDIFFIDIGPVWQGHEGDAGATFTVGNDPAMKAAKIDVKAVFDATHARWREDGLTGLALYRFAAAEAARRGWVLNLDMAGHRLADFPHAVLHDGTMSAIDYAPADALWVLEIQIRHPERSFSAFHEDLLLLNHE